MMMINIYITSQLWKANEKSAKILLDAITPFLYIHTIRTETWCLPVHKAGSQSRIAQAELRSRRRWKYSPKEINP